MITLHDEGMVVVANTLVSTQEAQAKGLDVTQAKKETLAARILAKHARASQNTEQLSLRFDALASHDITYVGIIQTARASGLTHFPLPYILTNCHNSLCAVGGTINEDDHLFGLSCAKKYGGTYVPANLAVIHQYVRECLVTVGGMILGSDSHTRYGALGCMGFGEGGPELVKQLLNRTYDIPSPKVVCVWLEGEPQPGVGPHDVALALIGKVFGTSLVQNAILEFHGPGIKHLSAEYRSGIDVMTTETTCLSSIWETDATIEAYYAAHGRADAYHPLTLTDPAAFDGAIAIDLSSIPSMIALPFHPSASYPIAEVIAHAQDYLGALDEEAEKRFGAVGNNLRMQAKYHDNGIWVDQGIIAGCAGGSYENIALTAQILDGASIGCDAFSLSLYPASQIVAIDLVRKGFYTKAMAAGGILKNAFCGPCFGAGDTPANGCLSIRHSTRNFPNREGSKPASGQLAAVALMDARSIAATAKNKGKLTPATDLPPSVFTLAEPHTPDMAVYEQRIYSGFDKAQPQTPIIQGPNITDWPTMEPLPTHLVLQVASHITDPVTTTDELIPSGETSSLRSNPKKLAEFTLSRKDPGYVDRAKAFFALEMGRRAGDAQAKDTLASVLNQCAELPKTTTLNDIGFGTTIFAIKPGDGSAREQAASCQKVLGGWANLAVAYATKRYRSNLINWGMLPFLIDENEGAALSVGDILVLPHIRDAIANGATTFPCICCHKTSVRTIQLTMQPLTKTEQDILLAGCLINYYQSV